MKKNRFGLVLFWIAIIWAILWGVIGSIIIDGTYRKLSMDEVNQTMWAATGPWFLTWGVLGVPIAALIALIGIALLFFKVLGHGDHFDRFSRARPDNFVVAPQAESFNFLSFFDRQCTNFFSVFHMVSQGAMTDSQEAVL